MQDSDRALKCQGAHLEGGEALGGARKTHRKGTACAQAACKRPWSLARGWDGVGSKNAAGSRLWTSWARFRLGEGKGAEGDLALKSRAARWGSRAPDGTHACTPHSHDFGHVR